MKKITKTKKWPWKWQFLVMSRKILFWVNLQTYLEPKFEVPSFKNEEVIWFLVNASSNLKIQKKVSEIREIQMKPSTDFFKIHLQLFFYVCSVIFHWKIQSDPPKNLVAAFRQCALYDESHFGIEMYLSRAKTVTVCSLSYSWWEGPDVIRPELPAGRSGPVRAFTDVACRTY